MQTRNLSIGHECSHTPQFCQSYDGQELYKYWINAQANPKVHKYMADQHSGKLSNLQVNYFLRYAWTSWKLQIYTYSRAITLTELKEIHMQNPRRIALQCCWSLFLKSWLILTQALKEHITQHNGTVFTKSRAINLTKQNKSTSKTTGAQRHTLSNITLKFQDARPNTFLSYVRHKLEIVNVYKVKGIYSKTIKHNHMKMPRCTFSHADQHSCKVSWLKVKYFLSYMWHKLKMANIY
jgi:hypothetical protein